MTDYSIRPSLMPWDSEPGTERLYKTLVAIGLILVVILYFLVRGIELPEREEEEVSERFAQLIVEEEPEVEPPPVIEETEPDEPEPVEEEVEPEPEEELPKPVEQPAPVEKPEQTVEEAREAVKSKGLLSFSDSLSSMRRSSSVTDSDAPLITSKASERRVDAGDGDFDTDLSSDSGGVDTDIAGVSGSAGNLGDRQVANVNRKVETTRKAKTGSSDSSGGSQGSLRRSPQQIAAALKTIQGRLDFLYNKARRRNPMLQGTVVFRVKLDTNGKVLQASVVRSDLNDAALEKDMAGRIQLLANFGPGPAETLEFPAEFTP
ncbi:MAG: AgmX/PglI C-terminal domain-containing protein [Pseudomonadota bacterium]